MSASRRLAEGAPGILELLRRQAPLAGRFSQSQLKVSTIRVPMRDGIHLATELYRPPVSQAPVIAVRTPYGRHTEANGFAAGLRALACEGYIVVSQDCRGTGDSEPDSWDYYVFESEDGYDFADWIIRQDWYGGFIGSFGSSYVGQTQWCMATHPAMSALVPGVSGLGIATNTAHLHMFVNAYARSVGKGDDKTTVSYDELEKLMLDETLNTGIFNQPLHRPFPPALLRQYPQLTEWPPSVAKRWLWAQYCALTCAERAEFVKRATGADAVTIVEVEALPAIFGQEISHDRHTLPHVCTAKMCASIQAPPLLRTGWYDWGLNDALATWVHLRRHGRPDVARDARMIIGPHAHNMPGYREDAEEHPELLRVPRTLGSVSLLGGWYEAVRHGAVDQWPTVIYYLMGANDWRVATDWPVPEAKPLALYLSDGGRLGAEPPRRAVEPDRYTYDPRDPTPTVGGSIVSYVYPPGSVDVSSVQGRADVCVFTTEVLEQDFDVVGPLRLILYASSSTPDTDFVARLSDVFPDGRAIQLQNGLLRVRYRDPAEPQWLEPHRISRLEIDLWATANRFKAGHRLRLDICSADFPRFDRNSNRDGTEGSPVPAEQTLHHDPEHPSHLLLSVLQF